MNSGISTVTIWPLNKSSNLDDPGAVVSIYDAAGQRLVTQVAGVLTIGRSIDGMGKVGGGVRDSITD